MPSRYLIVFAYRSVCRAPAVVYIDTEACAVCRWLRPYHRRAALIVPLRVGDQLTFLPGGGLRVWFRDL